MKFILENNAKFLSFRNPKIHYSHSPRYWLVEWKWEFKVMNNFFKINGICKNWKKYVSIKCCYPLIKRCKRTLLLIRCCRIYELLVSFMYCRKLFCSVNITSCHHNKNRTSLFEHTLMIICQNTITNLSLDYGLKFVTSISMFMLG